MSDLIAKHLRHLKAADQSPATIQSRERLLHALHDALPFGLAYASTDELEDWLGHDPTWSKWTRRTYANHIRAFYRWANGRGIWGDPSADMAKQKAPDMVPNPVTDDELAQALARSSEPWHTAIALAAFAGLRASELAGVHREDVTEETVRIRIAKGGSPASVDTHPRLWELVEHRPAGPLVVRQSGLPVTGLWLGKNGKHHFESIGLPDVTMHRFRHWFGSALLDSCNNLRTVQEALRHKHVSSTQGYTLVRGGQRRLAIRSLPTPTQNPDEN